MASTFLTTMFALNFFIGFHLYAAAAAGVPYDYSYQIECVSQPEKPLYNGGILENPEFNEGLKGWRADNNAYIQLAKSYSGNYYAIASNLTKKSDGISQAINAQKGIHYSISAWIQVAVGAQGETKVQGIAKTSTSDIPLNWIFAKTGCWKMLKGGFVANATESVDLQFQVRKTKVRLEVVDLNGKPVANASVSIRQQKPHFPFGGLLNYRVLENTLYQKWFLERYTHAAFENELKWSFDEFSQGAEDYRTTDAMLEFTKANGLITRGHNILWDSPQYMRPWMKALSPDQLREAAVNRIKSVVGRYKGQFIHWDVVNENMHYDSISKVFPGKSSDIFKLAYKIDPAPVLFLNEFNVIEGNTAFAKAGTPVFLAKIDELRSGGYDGPLGIGLQCHFHDKDPPNIPAMRAALDMFAATGLTIWATEFTVSNNTPNQVQLVMPLLRELHSHPAVEGILMWTALDAAGECFAMCLTDTHYKNIPVGDVVDDFMRQFIRIADSIGTTDCDGVFKASLVYGEYEAIITRAEYSEFFRFNLLPKENVTTVVLEVKG